ncbi:MAG: hypothetical protein GKC53_05245 [Neisseriaceae bacterium]|nr:MAG: hypothetical protein GKC53_05245 [Neisseriaceae bacterium]
MIPEIYFYIKTKNKLVTLCQLLQKILETTDHRVIILTEDNLELQEELSHELWSIFPDSFLANEILAGDYQQPFDTPILITSSLDRTHDSNDAHILVDLTLSINNSHFFEKIIFLFGVNEMELNIARELYKHYQQNKYPIKYFDMST